MPAHASHLLQPLDVGVFGPLKHSYGKLLEQWMISGNNHIDKEDFLSLYLPTRKWVFTSENICKGFTGAGLKPLDKEQVFLKITFQLHMLTPPALVESSASSTFQTPQNTRQLDYKIRSLQNSLAIRGQKLSSSLIFHIHHFEKAAQISMNLNLLLQQEIKTLRAENEQKTRKKARKRTTLGSDTILFIQEGQVRVQ